MSGAGPDWGPAPFLDWSISDGTAVAGALTRVGESGWQLMATARRKLEDGATFARFGQRVHRTSRVIDRPENSSL